MPKTLLRKFNDFIEKNSRLVVPTMLLVGLIIDFLTFANIQPAIAFLLLTLHSMLAGALILFTRFQDERTWYPNSKSMKWALAISPLIIQFNFGALLSASLVFYWFSGALSASWPIIALIVGVMIANERFRELYLRPNVQLGVYYFANFSLITLILPYIFNSISAFVFVLGGILSFCLIHAYIILLTIVTKAVRKDYQIVRRTVLGIFLSLNVLYFANIIPPIPLALKDADVYHFLQRNGQDYTAVTEEQPLDWIVPGETLNILEGNPVYVYTAIFSPAKIDTEITHHWQYYDPELHTWVSKDELSFEIVGGREDGFRGFTMKSALAEGRWRVDVETKRGQTLGRIQFRVNFVDELPELITITK
jgi:hypothetical protein